MRKHRPTASVLALLLCGALAAEGASATPTPPTPRSPFDRVTLVPLEVPATSANGLEKRGWGLTLRTADSDDWFPEREPTLMIAMRSVDPKSKMIQNASVVVRTAKPSSFFGSRARGKKLQKLKKEAVDQAKKELVSPRQALGQPIPFRISVLPLASRPIDRALAHALTTALVRRRGAEVLDLDSAEAKLAEFGLSSALAEGSEVDPPLADWAIVLGVDIVVGVRASDLKLVSDAEEGNDVLLADAVWSSASGQDFGAESLSRTRVRMFPARGSLAILVSAADRLADAIQTWVPEAAAVAIASGTTLGTPPGDRLRAMNLLAVSIDGKTANASRVERTSRAAQGPRSVGVAGEAGGSGTADDALLARRQAAAIGARRAIAGIGAEVYTLSEQAGAIGRTNARSTGTERGVSAIGGGSGTMDELGLAGSGARGTGSARDAAMLASISGNQMETVPVVLSVPETGSIEVSCAVVPPAGAAGKSTWILYHPIDATSMFTDAGRIVDKATRGALDQPGTKVRIVGHSCSLGTPGHNRVLALRRANTIKLLLLKRGVDASRIEIETAGQQKPLCTNATRIGRSHNRRTEIRLVEGP